MIIYIFLCKDYPWKGVLMKNKLLLALSSLFLLVGCQQGDVTESPINSEPAKTACSRLLPLRLMSWNTGSTKDGMDRKSINIRLP